MKKYSTERKEAILKQMMPPMNKSVAQLARENGISSPTLYTWCSELKSQGLAVPGDGKNAEDWTSEDKFGVVLETAALNATELADYCRRKGLFAEQIDSWRKVCAQANANARQTAKGVCEEAKEDKKRIQQLESTGIE